MNPAAVTQPFHPSSPRKDALVTGSEARRDVLTLFGLPQVRYGDADRQVMLDWHKPTALLAYLACRPEWHSRESLADALRPEANAQAARAYLRRLLHRTREVLPMLRSLDVEDGKIRWSGGSDVRAFELAVEQADWQRAIELQKEPLLHNVGSTGEPALDDWFHEERLRLHQRLRAALMAWISRVQRERGADCADLMQRLADHDPMDENGVQFLLEHARTPLERHTAAAAFQTLQRRCATELGQKPLPKTFELYRSLQDGSGPKLESRASAAPTEALVWNAQQSAGRAAHPNPAPLGRDAEINSLDELLHQDGVRLVTIYGLGGVGKTSLARALFAKATRDHQCAWVDLLAADTLHAMLDEIASQVGMTVHDGSVEDQLAHWLAARQMVVFLDNFEQLTAHAAVLTRLLKAARGTRFVITSREALRLPDEYSFALPGLACHGNGSPAFELFNLHATRMGHVIPETDMQYAIDLVAYLEGLPLAIELAAKWVPLLPAKSILAELRNDPAFIDAAADSDPASTRSMRSMFNATWRRLDSTEQDALVSLSTVLGSMALDTARAIAAVDASVF